ncbi:MAG: glutamate--tRNA ligase [Pseudomonadota bacterium]
MSGSSEIITRFAPSPTGFLHIGGARTALFNWLFAKNTGGKMLLRIEDTDRQRSTPEAIDAILDGLQWLGLNWDDETIYQFARADRHRTAVQQLLDQDRAYKCYATPEELDEMRKTAQAAGQPMRYDGRWRDRDEKEAPPGIKPAIRLRAQDEGETIIDDSVQGRVVFNNKDLDDLVLLRSDGNPTYMLAVVVDDHDMGVTHIIRGVDHLTNAARQSQIYQAFGWTVPKMAHIPLIHGADGAKLSKRHGALGVEAYRAMGILPEAMRNYLVRLGWSHGDQEIFSTEELIQLFSLASVGKSAARFDPAKLENINGHYMRTLPDEKILDEFIRALPYLPNGPEFLNLLTPDKKNQLKNILAPLKERAKTFIELIDAAQFLVAERPLQLDAKAQELVATNREKLAAIFPVLSTCEDFRAEPLEIAVKAHAEQHEIKLAQIAQPLRASLTGKATSPGIFDVLAVLGREESLARIKDQLTS